MQLIFLEVRFWALAIAALGIAACGGSSNSFLNDHVDGRLSVVTTVSPITSIVENVGGPRIRLEAVSYTHLRAHET